METKKLYYEDSHREEFTAEVLECLKKDEEFFIVLDQTAFFPEGGGQAADLGRLGNIEVEDVQEKGNIIYHKVKIPIEKGSVVEGKIDFSERFSRMQNHSGEHIISGLVHRHFGYDNIGFHMGSEAITMDFNGELTKENLREIEKEANEAVVKNLPILSYFLEKEELKNLEYRSKIEIEGQVRIVEIPGYDKCACCAPHVKRTGEIGVIKLLSGQRYKGGTRVSMLCGFRALEDYHKKMDSVSEISVLLSVKQNEVEEAVKHLKEELFQAKGLISDLRTQIFKEKVQKIKEGERSVYFFEEGISTNEMRYLMNMALEKVKEFCIVFVPNQEGFQYIAGSKTKDIREFGEEFQKRFEGKGGGKKEMIQGSVKGKKEEIESFIKECL